MAFGFRQCLSAFGNDFRLSANDFRQLPKADSFAESHFSCSAMILAKRIWECFRGCCRKLLCNGRKQWQGMKFAWRDVMCKTAKKQFRRHSFSYVTNPMTDTNRNVSSQVSLSLLRAKFVLQSARKHSKPV